MPDEIVKVENGAVQLALSRFAMSLKDRGALLKVIGEHQIASAKQTMLDQGSPANSWAPLAESTIRNKKSRASAGRKILILSARLFNSFTYQVTDTGVTIGTNLPYARVQQEGSADRGVGEGPQARIDDRDVDVRQHNRFYVHRLGTAQHEISDKNGRTRKVRAVFLGPYKRLISVASHNRFQNIPGRPYLIFRPEDPAWIQGQVIAFGVRAAVQAGLQAEGAS